MITNSGDNHTDRKSQAATSKSSSESSPRENSPIPLTYSNFEEFYVAYMSFHTKPLSNLLHFSGITLLLATVFYVEYFSVSQSWKFTVPAAAIGYALAWIGHFAVEKNKPASFNNPLWSIRAGLRMYIDMLRGKVKIW